MKFTLLAILATFLSAGYANETTYMYMDSAAPHDNHSAAYPDRAQVRTSTVREKMKSVTLLVSTKQQPDAITPVKIIK